MLGTNSNTSLTKNSAAPGQTRMYPNLSFDLVTDLSGLRALEPQWRILERRAEASFTYFQTYNWCERWFTEFGSSDGDDGRPQARIFTADEQGDPVLIWPLMIEQGPMGLNSLTWMTWPHGEYGNVLAEPGERADAAIAACWGHIQRLPKIDTIELANIPATSALARALFDDEDYTDAQNLSSIMDLGRFETVQDYVNSLSKTTRRGRGRRRRKLETYGALDFAVFEGGTSQYREAVREALRMKDVWLEKTGKVSRALSMDGNERFLCSLPAGEGTSGRALVGVLTLDGKPISIEIGFERGGDYVSYLGAFEWELRGYSPGKIEMDLMLRWAIDNNLKTYDLLGNASSYKDDWSNLEVPLLTRLDAQSVLGLARTELWVKRLRPALKHTVQVLPEAKRRMLVSALGNKSSG